MSRLVAAKLIVAAGFLAISGVEAAAFCLWRCERAYPPMYVPADDQRVGPTWTRNGWIYPLVPGYLEPMPYVVGGYGLKDYEAPRARPIPREWR